MLIDEQIKAIVTADESQLHIISAQVKALSCLVNERLKQLVVKDLAQIETPRGPGRRSKYPKEVLDQVYKLIREGGRNKDIAAVTGMPASYVSTLKQRAKRGK